MRRAGGTYTTQMECDSGNQQQDWLQNVVYADSDICIFKDVTDLPGRALAQCARHGKLCLIKKSNFLCVAGFCCHGLSKQSQAYIKGENTTVLEDKKGTSGETFDAVVGYSSDCAKLELNENVEDLLNEKSKNRQLYVDTWENRGFASGIRGYKGTAFGTRTTRLMKNDS